MFVWVMCRIHSDTQHAVFLMVAANERIRLCVETTDAAFCSSKENNIAVSGALD